MVGLIKPAEDLPTAAAWFWACWAWFWAWTSGLSRAAQAMSYESARRNYRRWVYGVSWIRQDVDKAAEEGAIGRIGAALAASTEAIVAERGMQVAPRVKLPVTVLLRFGGAATTARRGITSQSPADLDITCKLTHDLTHAKGSQMETEEHP